MAVNLSPVGGVAAQFFTNTGAVLTGGKIYTYAAGTTTPQTTFTSSNGAVPWTNPIVLDAAGRVPSGGEIWLTDGISYKFILRDSNDVLIATYDNITGINSNSVSFTNQQQIITATANQTVFNLSINYQVGTNSLSVFVDGVNQYGPGAQYAYTETSSTSVTFVSGLHVGAQVKFTTTQQQGAGAVNASQVTYNPAGTGAVATNVQAKLRETVSITDFGAVGDGVTNNTAAIQAAIDALPEGGTLYVPTASNHYLFTTLNITKSLTICGEGYFSLVNAAFGNAGYLSASMVKGSVLRTTQTTGYAFNVNNATFNNILNFNNLAIVGPGSGTSIGIYTPTNNPAISLDVSNILVANFYIGLSITSAFESVFVRLGVFGCTTGFFVPYDSADYFSDNQFYACQFQWCAKGLHLDSGSGINIENSVFQACTSIGIELTPQSNGRVETVHINKCWLENSGAGVKSISLNVTNGSMKFLTFCDNRMGAGSLEFKRDTGSFTLNYLSFERNYFGAATTTIPTWVQNCQVNTTEFLSLTNNSQSFTPTWSADSVNPAIGNGSLTGLCQTNAGVVTLTIKVSMGSTTTFGTGAWFFGGLPFVPNQDTVGSVLMYDDSTGNYYSGTCLLGPSVSTVARVQANGTGRISSSIPFTWAANDYLLLNITFPV